MSVLCGYGSRRSLLSRLGAVTLAAFVLSVAMVWGPGTPAARAWSPPPEPVSVGGKVERAVPGSLLKRVFKGRLGALFTLGQLGLSLATVGDSWLPTDPERLTGGGTTSTPDPDGGLPAFDISWDFQDGVLSGVVYPLLDNTPGGSALRFRWRCKSGDGTVGALQEAYELVGLAAGYNARPDAFSERLCPAGSVVVYAKGWMDQKMTDGLQVLSEVVVYTAPYDPAEQVTTATVTCRTGPGTYVETVEVTEGRADRVGIPSCDDVAPGAVPVGIVIEGGASWDPDPQKIGEVTVSEDELFQDYGDCLDASGLKCDLQVFISGSPCTIGDLLCRSWWPYAKAHPSRVQCRWGSHVMPLSDCEPLRYAYERPTTWVGTWPNGDTKRDPSPANNPRHESDPAGQGLPKSGTNPGTVPETTPETDPESQGCWGETWSWNPVSWVYTPVKCALVWAFVPSDGYMSGKIQGLRARWQDTTPAKWVQALQGWTPGAMNGCGGFLLDFTFPGTTVQVHERIGAACSGAMADAAGIVRITLSAVIVTAGLLTCVRAVGSGLGWSPGVKGGDE